jgi:hypothetical protein
MTVVLPSARRIVSTAAEHSLFVIRTYIFTDDESCLSVFVRDWTGHLSGSHIQEAAISTRHIMLSSARKI